MAPGLGGAAIGETVFTIVYIEKLCLKSLSQESLGKKKLKFT
jgi:hypothetical protein